MQINNKYDENFKKDIFKMISGNKCQREINQSPHFTINTSNDKNMWNSKTFKSIAMKNLISLIILFFYSTLVGATVDHSTSSSSITSSTATSSVNLVSEINKKTQQGLKAFKGLTKDDQ